MKYFAHQPLKFNHLKKIIPNAFALSLIDNWLVVLAGWLFFNMQELRRSLGASLFFSLILSSSLSLSFFFSNKKVQKRTCITHNIIYQIENRRNIELKSSAQQNAPTKCATSLPTECAKVDSLAWLHCSK